MGNPISSLSSSTLPSSKSTENSLFPYGKILFFFIGLISFLAAISLFIAFAAGGFQVEYIPEGYNELAKFANYYPGMFTVSLCLFLSLFCSAFKSFTEKTPNTPAVSTSSDSASLEETDEEHLLNTPAVATLSASDSLEETDEEHL